MRNTNETQPIDPIALTLAVWLGLVVSVTGLMRLSENAANQAALAEMSMPSGMAAASEESRSIDVRVIAFGG